MQESVGTFLNMDISVLGHFKMTDNIQIFCTWMLGTDDIYLCLEDIFVREIFLHVDISV